MKGEKIDQTQEARNLGVLKAWLPAWVWNSASNFEKVKNEFLVEKRDLSLVSQRDKYKGPAIVVGSGPSLDKTAPFLKDWQGAIFCGSSNAKVLRRWGREPDYLCIYDSGPDTVKHINDMDWDKTTLFTHPSVTPALLEFWKWSKYYYIMMHNSYCDKEIIEKRFICKESIDNMLRITDPEEMKASILSMLGEHELFVRESIWGEDFFKIINPILFPYIKTMVLNAGCVVNNEIQIARFIGYDPIILVGCDFGYSYDQHRRTGWNFVGDKWQEVDPGPIPESREKHISDNGILTTEEQIEYKIALLSIWAQDRPQLIDCSDGILTEIPKISIEEVIKTQGVGLEHLYRTHEQVIEVVKDFYIKKGLLK